MEVSTVGHLPHSVDDIFTYFTPFCSIHMSQRLPPYPVLHKISELSFGLEMIPPRQASEFKHE